IALTTMQSPNALAVAVMDSGPGIPAAECQRVFQRFYRLERSRSTPGSGLGLSLVAAGAALYQGSIELKGNRPCVRVVLRFLAPDQPTLTGDPLAWRERRGKPCAVKDVAPSSVGIPNN